MNVMFGKSFERQEADSEDEVDIEQRRLPRNFNEFGENFRSLSNSNVSEKSHITVETRGAINSEISSQMSKKLEKKIRFELTHT